MKLDVGCGSKPSGDVNVDVFRQGWNPQEGDQHRGEFLSPKLISNFVVATVDCLPFSDNVFDVVSSSHVIEHVEHPFRMLKEMVRVSKRKVVVRCPHRLGSGARMPFHINFFDLNSFKSVANSLGVHGDVFVSFFDCPLTARLDRVLPRCFRVTLFWRALKHLERNKFRSLLRVPYEIEARYSKVESGSSLVFVVVYNNAETLRRCFYSSSHITEGNVVAFSNERNVPLPTFFNSVVENFKDQNVWLVFCHQDFILNEPLVLNGLNQLAVYGVIGFRYGYEKPFGQITQTDGSLVGNKLKEILPVETVDELCLIVHSDVFKSGLRFDDRFRFHFYGADLCMQARNLGFEVYAMQLACKHKSKTLNGDVISPEYFRSVDLFEEKWKRSLPIRTSTRVFS